MKTVAPKTKASGAACACANGQPRSSSHIEELKAQLTLILQPNYELGDYYPRLDRRLCGLFPDLIAQALDALEARYPCEHITAGKNHERAD